MLDDEALVVVVVVECVDELDSQAKSKRASERVHSGDSRSYHALK